MNKKILFITWDGPQTAYLENLFLPLFSQLLSAGWNFHIVQFSWLSGEQTEARRRVCARSGAGFTLVGLPNNRRSLRAAIAVAKGIITVHQTVRRESISIVLFRSILPALIVRLAFVQRRVALVYDSDGLPIEEKIEQGGLVEGTVAHRLLAAVEKWALRSSDVVLARSSFGASSLARKVNFPDIAKKVRVVSNGRVGVEGYVALSKGFIRPHGGETLRLCYLGSWGESYRPGRMMSVVESLKKEFPRTSMDILTGDVDQAKETLRIMGLNSAEWINVRRVEPESVSDDLRCYDLGFSFRQASPANRSTAPIKLGEYLEAGVAIAGDLIGDSSGDIVEAGLMFVVDNHSEAELFRWVRERVIRARTRRRREAVKLGKDFFGIEIAVREFDDVFRLADA